MIKRYKAVFFDLGGTLRIAYHEDAYERHARRKMAELAGTDLPFEEFYQLVENRYEPYRKWALGENREAGDEELWCQWLLPDFDIDRIRQLCHELSFQYRQSKGRRVVVDGGEEVIRTLHDIDLMRWFLDSEVSEIFALGGTFKHPEFRDAGDEETAVAALRFQNGAMFAVPDLLAKGRCLTMVASRMMAKVPYREGMGPWAVLNISR